MDIINRPSTILQVLNPTNHHILISDHYTSTERWLRAVDFWEARGPPEGCEAPPATLQLQAQKWMGWDGYMC